MKILKKLAHLSAAVTVIMLSTSIGVQAVNNENSNLVTNSISKDHNASTYKNNKARSLYMDVFGETSAPLGYMGFCSRNPADCKGGTTRPLIVELDAKSWATLNEVNLYSNRLIAPVSDQDLYGQVEMWVYPTNKGDCEDYVLMKQKQLIDLGWPKEALLITVAIDENGGGHAVLTVKTNVGDLILDNQRPEILPWQQTTLTYVKRQSTSHPALWVALSSVD